MSPRHNGVGYWGVTICAGGKQLRKLVHTLVAEAFLGPKPDGCEINHLDFNPSNNRLSNLEWTTKRRNLRHMREAQRRSDQKLNLGSARLLKALASLGRFTHRELGEMFGVHRHHAWMVATGRSWKWI
jgi:hypothetical protein